MLFSPTLMSSNFVMYLAMSKFPRAPITLKLEMKNGLFDRFTSSKVSFGTDILVDLIRLHNISP